MFDQAESLSFQSTLLFKTPLCGVDVTFSCLISIHMGIIVCRACLVTRG